MLAIESSLNASPAEPAPDASACASAAALVRCSSAFSLSSSRAVTRLSNTKAAPNATISASMSWLRSPKPNERPMGTVYSHNLLTRHAGQCMGKS